MYIAYWKVIYNGTFHQIQFSYFGCNDHLEHLISFKLSVEDSVVPGIYALLGN